MLYFAFTIHAQRLRGLWGFRANNRMKDKPDNAIYTTLEQKNKTLSESASDKAERRMSQVSTCRANLI